VTFDDPAWLEKERQWLGALARGDGTAFDQVFQAFAGPLYQRVLLPKLGEPAAAEDALAETFRRALERLPRFEDRGKGLWPYLATIATNLAHDVHRERARRGRALASFESLLAPLETPGPQPGDGPDQAKVRAAVSGVLSALNPRYRQAIELRFFAEHSREECARMLEVKVGTFDVLLLRALRSFRERWQDMVGAPPEAA
jgi:RNA polymerase sigma factor (sigma-70 family)